MSRRVAGLMLCALALGLLLALDGPQSEQLVEASVGPARAQAGQAAQEKQAAQEAPAAQLDDSVVDLFAGAGGSASAAVLSQAATGEEPRAVVPVTLLGFKEENGTRDAYLLHDGAVHMVRAGAVLVQRYRVLALQQDAVHLQDQQTGEKIRIAFGDNE